MMFVKESIPATLIIDGGIAALRLNSPESKEFVYLSYALITQGPEYQVFPSLVLDDWGNEIKNIGLYHWIRENGLRFPRAEVFGVDPTGAEVQYFLRDMELLARYPTYAFTEKSAPAVGGVLIKALLIPDEVVNIPQPAEPPADINAPLRESNVIWWRVNPQQNEWGFIHKFPFAPE